MAEVPSEFKIASLLNTPARTERIKNLDVGFKIVADEAGNNSLAFIFSEALIMDTDSMEAINTYIVKKINATDRREIDVEKEVKNCIRYFLTMCIILFEDEIDGEKIDLYLKDNQIASFDGADVSVFEDEYE